MGEKKCDFVRFRAFLGLTFELSTGQGGGILEFRASHARTRVPVFFTHPQFRKKAACLT